MSLLQFPLSTSIDTINDTDEGIGPKRPAAVTERHTLVVAGGKELIELALKQLISTGQTKTSCHGEGNVLDAMTHRGRWPTSQHSCSPKLQNLQDLFIYVIPCVFPQKQE